MYEVFLTHEAQRFYEQADPILVRKLNRCFQCLRANPYEHPNIKRLKGPLSGHFRYQTEARLIASAFTTWIGSGS